MPHVEAIVNSDPKNLIHRQSVGPFCVTPKGIDVQGEPTREEWERLGPLIGRASSCFRWCVGDWLAFGESKWGVTTEQAAELTGFVTQTLYNLASVSRAVEFSRRRENLSWSHHEAVACLSPEVGDEILARAESDSLSVGAVRQLKIAAKNPPPQLPPTTDNAAAGDVGDQVDHNHSELSEPQPIPESPPEESESADAEESELLAPDEADPPEPVEDQVIPQPRTTPASGAKPSEPPHPAAHLMGLIKAASAEFNRLLKADDEFALRFRRYAKWCSLVWHHKEQIKDGGEVVPARDEFLLLRGAHKLVSLAAEEKTKKQILHAWDVATGGFVPPKVAFIKARREEEKKRAAGKAVQS